ncbi:autotransporter outer membrane beta-barrel domain-containing protein [Labrys neptuniae]|uniref:autotransporter outer membrane beta-barrel domain-containing protein n=1 Tax=Labrys neptuniae TaxID=376174 RepID=UPI00288FABD4|nr:autotransporter outer membrane beta-barrel domain-containing protein [Labrys neptuniae]MDT3377906.1 autotransporter outer membrane beta-barrel domain-containing protein [Labrys neptuniae]
MSSRLVGKHKKSSSPLGATLTVGSPVRVAQRGLAHPKALTSTIAIAAALSCGGMVAAPGAAFAGSCDPATFVCSGAASPTQNETGQILGNGTAPVAVTTQSGFGINAGVGGVLGDAFYIRGSGGTSFTDTTGATITGLGGIDIAEQGAGALVVKSTGSITGTVNGGILAQTSATSTGLTIDVNNVTGNGYGIDAVNNGTGSMAITSSGVITSAGGDGIIATMGGNSTGLTINVNEVNAGDNGINLNGNAGTGDISVTANTINADSDNGGIGIGIVFDNGPNTHDFTVNVGTITGGGGGGIFGYSSGNGNTDITVGSIATTGGNGIDLRVDASPGAGYTKVNVGDITANAGNGILVNTNANTTDLTITANNVTAGANGIQALNGGTGKSAVTTHGDVVADGAYGIYNVNTAAATGDLTVNTDAGTTTHGTSFGIYTENNGTGNLVITAPGSSTTNEFFTIGSESGIYAINNNTTSNSSIQITAGDTTGAGFGILATNHSNGGIHIESNGTAKAGFGLGGWAAIEANNFGTGDVYVKANNAYGDMGGVNVVNADTATGKIDVIVTGKATTIETEFPEHGGGNAVNVIAGVNTKAINVAVNNATGNNDGIYTEQHGTGTTTITTTGIVEGNTHGIHALTAGTAITINNSGTVRNTSNSSLSEAIFANGPATITNSGSGLITGSVQLVSDKGNTVNNAGTWDTAGATNNFGAGTANNGVNNTGTIIAAKDGAAVANTAFNQVGTFTNGGVLTMADKGAGDTTTIDGDYVGNGGTVEIDTELGDDSSKTDKLVINGDATGSTKLTVHNVGGLGAQTDDGIRVIEVGGTSDANAFRLTSAVAAGAYDYGLYLGGASGANDWFLRSTNELNAEAQTSVVYAGALSHFAQATLGTLQQRTGGRIWPNGGSQVAADLPSDQVMKYAPGGPVIYGQGAWGRVGGLYASYDPKKGGSYTQGIGFLQAGYEGTAYETTDGQLTLGAYATVGRSWVKVDTTRDPVTGAARSKGKITSNGYGVGVNATWLGNDGLYADAIGQFTWYDTNLSNKNGSSQGWASALSLEVGKRFDVGSGWSVVPQAQLSWTHVDFSSFTDTLGNRVSIGDGDSVLGRLGVRVENLSSWKGEDGETRRLQFYGIANLSYEFMGDTSVKIAGATVEQQDKRLWGEIGTGATYAWNDKSSLYAEASYGHALASGDNYSAKGTVGFRYKW